MLDFRSIGSRMPRRRDERGYVYKVGKTIKKWEGRYHIYVRLPDLTEKRLERTKILGSCAELSKRQAEEELRRVILQARGQQRPFLDPPNFEEVWKRYRTLKASAWSSATQNAVVSIFEGNSKKKQHPNILKLIGHWRVSDLTRDPLQQCLNQLAERGDSYSAVKKARTYISAALNYAVDERLLISNPAQRIELPSRRLRKPCGRFYSIDEIRRLFSATSRRSLREHLIVRLFLVCGLRPQELFILRLDDVEPGVLRIDEALKEAETRDKRVGEPKSPTSNGYVATSPGLDEELDLWIRLRNASDPYHKTVQRESNSLLFPNECGGPFRIGNYLKRVLKPIALEAGISDMTYQALRRTFSTHFQKYGSPKDAQTQLRHSRLEMTGWYMKAIPEQVRAAVEKMDEDLFRTQSQRIRPLQ